MRMLRTWNWLGELKRRVLGTWDTGLRSCSGGSRALGILALRVQEASLGHLGFCLWESKRRVLGTCDTGSGSRRGGSWSFWFEESIKRTRTIIHTHSSRCLPIFNSLWYPLGEILSPHTRPLRPPLRYTILSTAPRSFHVSDPLDVAASSGIAVLGTEALGYLIPSTALMSAPFLHVSDALDVAASFGH